MVLARARAGVTRFCTVVRPGGVVAVLAALAALLGATWLRPFSLSSTAIGRVAVPLLLRPANSVLLQALLAFGVVMLVLAWWLPGGRHAAQWALLALAGMVAPLFLADDVQAACALLVAAAALAPILVHGDDDEPALLFLGMATVGVACLVAGLLIARSAGPAEWDNRLGPARLLTLAGLALLLGVAPAPLWLPGIVRHAHPLGAALAAAVFPFSVMAVALQIATSDTPFNGWLTSGLDGQVVAAAGVLTMIVAGIAAMTQRDLRGLAGFLLAADLGFMITGAGLGVIYDASLRSVILLPLATRALGIAILLPSLAFVMSGFRCSLRPALVLVLACGAWMALGGPLTPGYSLHAEIVWIMVDRGGVLAAGIIMGVTLLAVGWLALVVRAWRMPLAESPRPCPRLALLLMAAVAAGSLLLL